MLIMYKAEYLLSCIAEEGGEITQVACKCLRFGVLDSAPDSILTNEQQLVKEVNDLLAVVEMLEDEGYNLSGVGNREDIENKKDKVHRFMRYSRQAGTLE